MEKGLNLKVNVIIETINLSTQKVTKTSKVHNLVVNTGLNAVADLIAGFSSDVFEYMAIGEDNTAVVAGDTDLGIEVDRALVTPTDEGIGIIEYDETFTFGTGDSFTITEAGLFNSLTPTGSIMLNRLVFTGHDVDVDNGVRVRITITVANS